MSYVYHNSKATYFNNKAVFYDGSGSVSNIEINWDTYGVPHIEAPTEEDASYAFGWAQMKNHANLLIRLYLQGRGKAAEFLGSNQYESDLKIHRFNLPQIAQDVYNSFDFEEKNKIDAFVQGLNDSAQQMLPSIDSNIRGALPLTPQDVISHTKRVISLEFSGGSAISSAGSNAYAVSPSKSQSGNAMLVVNPHLPWSDFYTFFEAHLKAPSLNIYGATLVGIPIIMLGFNESLGWTHTVNTIDVADTYQLSLSGSGYLLDGVVQPFTERVVDIGVRQGNGSIQNQSVTIRQSQHGPILNQSGSIARAVRIAGLENSDLFKQYSLMCKASNLSQFESAVSMLQLPMFNVIYADKHGDIMYLFNGNVPIKSEGDWNFWGGIIDGTQSKYIWSSIHPYGDLPKLINPSTGWVQNANDTPWSSTYPFQLNASSYPSYMAPSLNLGFRAQRSLNLIRNTGLLSFDDLVALKLDTGMETADRLKSALLSAVASNPNPSATSAATILSNWDNKTDTDSVGALIFSRWFKKLNNSMFSNQWSAANPLSTPSGLSNPSQASTLLGQAANEIQNAFGTMSAPWGQSRRFIGGGQNFPANGADDGLGVFRTMYFGEETSVSGAWHGDTFVAVVEFDEEVKAKAILSYGNSSQGGNPFNGSQFNLMSENTLRDVFFKNEDILNNLHSTEILTR